LFPLPSFSRGKPSLSHIIGSPSARRSFCQFPIITSSSPWPAAIGAIAFQNKAVVYDLLFKTAAETLTTIAADPKHLGARLGLTAVLHTWGSALTHHQCPRHRSRRRPVAGRRALDRLPARFFLPVRVLSRLFRRLFLKGLAALHKTGRLAFFGDLALLADQSGSIEFSLTTPAAELPTFSGRSVDQSVDRDQICYLTS
jgi:hypothetical protein